MATIDFNQLPVNFDSTVYTIENGEIEEHWLSSICRQYAEETTSPRGVEPKLHIRKKKMFFYDGEWIKNFEEALTYKSIDMQDNIDNGDVEEKIRYEIWTWGHQGNAPYIIDVFETEEQAEYSLLLSYRYDLMNNPNAPIVYDSMEEAREALEELNDLG